VENLLGSATYNLRWSPSCKDYEERLCWVYHHGERTELALLTLTVPEEVGRDILAAALDVVVAAGGLRGVCGVEVCCGRFSEGKAAEARMVNTQDC